MALRRKLATTIGAICAAIGLIFMLLGLPSAGAAALTSVSLSQSDPRPEATAVTYDLRLNNVTTSTTRCVQVYFNTDGDLSGSKPTDMDISSLALSGSSTYMPTPASWNVSNDNVNGITEITYGTGETPASASNRHLILTDIVNGSVADTTFYVYVESFSDAGCTTSVDSAILAATWTDGQSLTFSILPTLDFTISGKSSGSTCNGVTTNAASTSSSINLGVPTPVTNRVAAQDLNITTNAGSGYTVYTRYTAAPSNGSNSIPDVSGSNASPGAFPAAGNEAFGYTTDDATLGTGTANRFTNGGAKWAPFVTTANAAEVAYSNTSATSDTQCVGYQIGVDGTTQYGTYATTIIYTAVPVF